MTVCVAILLVLTTFKPSWVKAIKNGELPLYQTSDQPVKSVLPQASFAEAASVAMPSVVSINVKQKQALVGANGSFLDYFFGEDLGGGVPRGLDSQAAGSGVILSEDGFIVTNNHVVENADSVEVILSDNRRLSAEVIGQDPETDIAILKVDAQNLKNIVFASSDSLRVGDVVLAIGNPFGVGKTVTMGIVSALGRSDLGINTFENFIQTDAPINPGNSGGALIDATGRLVGINTAIFSRSGGSLGIGFAVPVSTVQQIVKDLTQYGKVSRGFLGISTQALSPEIRDVLGIKEEVGVLVSGVQKDGPASKAGVKPGDVLLRVNQKPIVKPKDVLVLVSNAKPQEAVVLELLRDGKKITKSVVLGQRPQVLRKD